MKISELIAKLQQFQEASGDVSVVTWDDYAEELTTDVLVEDSHGSVYIGLN